MPTITDSRLIGTMAVRSALAVAAIQLVHNFHSVGNHSERSKTVPVQALIISVVDEYLGGPRIWDRPVAKVT